MSVLIVFPGTQHVFFTAAAAATESESRSPAQQTRLVAQKLTLLENLLNRPSGAARIEASNNEVAIASLKIVRTLMESARHAMGRGELSTAEHELNEALRLYSVSTSAVPQIRRDDEVQRRRYRELTDGIVSYRELLESGKDTVTASVAKQQAGLDEGEIDQVLKVASDMVQQEKYADANHLLGELYRKTVLAVSALRHNETVVYKLEFKGPEDEYDYEKKRYEGHRVLVEMMLASSERAETARQLAQKQLAKGEEQYDIARQAAGRGDYVAALKVIENATLALVRALRLLGLQVPS